MLDNELIAKRSFAETNSLLMKTIHGSFVIAIVLSLFCFSCDKDNFSNQTDLTSETPLTNPFDFVGELHNQGLDYIVDSYKSTKSNQKITIEEIELYTEEFCNSIFSSDNRFDVPFTRSSFSSDSVSLDSVFSDFALNYLNDIMQLFENGDYETIKDDVSEFENLIISNESGLLNEVEQSGLLCVLAVGKYSNEYWNDTYASTRALAPTKVAAADALGALRGIRNQAGVVLLSTMFGPGAVVGAAARAAIGPAIAGSAAYAFVEMW